VNGFLLLVGDHKQLAPISKSTKDPTFSHWSYPVTGVISCLDTLEPTTASKDEFDAASALLYISIIYTPNCASSITIFVQERERGRFNRARDGASRRPGRARESVVGATAESGGARSNTGRAIGSATLMPIRRSQFGVRGPLWASATIAQL
jgi:hypothetical protein